MIDQSQDQPLATERAQILEEIYDYVVSIPIRVELLGGQRTTYVQRASILDWLEVELEKVLAAPVSPDRPGREAEIQQRVEWTVAQMSQLVKATEGLNPQEKQGFLDGYAFAMSRLADLEQENGRLRAWKAAVIETHKADAETTANLIVLAQDAEAKVSTLRADLAQCYRLTGADPDGNDDATLAPHAVDEVKRMRQESDEDRDALDTLRAEHERLKAAAKKAFEFVANADLSTASWQREANGLYVELEAALASAPMEPSGDAGRSDGYR